MTPTEHQIRSISDTARWVAIYRARETEREAPLFRDPFARRLAGPRGEHLATALFGDRYAWSFIARTFLFDQLIMDQVRQGTDLVVNLAAGLDARPYRMDLPASLEWVEVDLPEILAHKEQVLRSEHPTCRLERVPLDLSQVSARRELFARLDEKARRALVISEGLVIYLAPEEVGPLATDLARPRSFQRWALDLASPGLLRMLHNTIGRQLTAGGASLRFAPREGPAFFARHGWEPVEVRSLLKTAARLKRLSPWMRLIAMLPESNGAQGIRPWSAVCLLAKP